MAQASYYDGQEVPLGQQEDDGQESTNVSEGFAVSGGGESVQWGQQRQNNTLPMWGNKETMNLNHLVLENILQSPYYRNKLSTLKTFHEVVDEIYYTVTHLEPWEKGTRRTTGQTGMCGGVRGVGAGGVVSTPFCILFKLFTMKLTRKQLCALLNHADSPFIRGLGFMYIRFCQHPNTFWEWYEPYLEDEEPIDPKAGEGDPMTIGQMCKIFLTKLEWYATLFPRIPVPVQKDLDVKMREHNRQIYDRSNANEVGEGERMVDRQTGELNRIPDERGRSGEEPKANQVDSRKERSRSKDRKNLKRRSTSPARRSPISKRARSRSKDRQSRRKEKRRSDGSREHRHRHHRSRHNDKNDERRRHKKSHKHRRHRSGSESKGRKDKKKRSRSPSTSAPGVDGGERQKMVAERAKAASQSPLDQHNESREEGEVL